MSPDACPMVLDYLPTQLGDFWGVYVGRYSSTMVRIEKTCIIEKIDFDDMESYGHIHRYGI